MNFDYMEDVGRDPLLTEEEELYCGRLVQEMMPLLEKPADELTRKEKHIIRRGRRARDRFVLGNMRMVASCARKYMHLAEHMKFQDLCQEGALGLTRAAEKYDPTRGYKFSTYAYWWIRQAISRSIGYQERMVRLPINLIDGIYSVRKHQERALQATGELPPLQESLDHAKVKHELWEQALPAYFDWTSTDKTIGQKEGDTSNLLDIIPDPRSGEHLEREMMKVPYQAVLMALDRVDEKNRSMICHYYGIAGAAQLTLAEIGKKHKISREAVRQRINKTTLALRVTTRNLCGAFND